MSAVRASGRCLATNDGRSHTRSSFGDYCIRCSRTLVREDHRRADDDVLEPLYSEEEVDKILAYERPWSTSRRSYGTTGRRIG